MEYQWYPGHMSKAKREMQDSLKLVDCLIELLDARIPYSSKNPDIDKMAQGKPRVILLNKADLADPKVTAEFKRYYESKGIFVAITNAKTDKLSTVVDIVKKACKEKIERDKAKGMINRPIRAMITGIPNVGKSTFINNYARKAVTKTGDKPGVTKGKQWIRLGKDLELLDTPGILWPKFEDQLIGLHIAWIGSINDNILDPNALAESSLKLISERYPGNINTRYGISEEGLTGDGPALLEAICKKRACMKKGGELDLEKMANMIMDDIRGGRLGKISLERPADFNLEG